MNPVGSTLGDKVFRPALFSGLLGPAGVIAFFVCTFTGMLIGAGVITLGRFLVSFILVWAISGIILATGRVVIGDNGLKRRFTFLNSLREVSWNEITKVTYLKGPLIGDIVYVHYADAGKDKFIPVASNFAHLREIIREIVARVPKGIPVDPRLYTSEVDRNLTVEMLVESTPGVAAYFLLIFLWNKIEAVANIPPQDIEIKTVVCLAIILPMYWVVPWLWEKIKSRQ